MMAYEMKDNSGSIFKNEKRESDNHPHGTGKALIDGKLYWVSAWTKEGAKGRFQSLAFKPVDDQQKPKAQQAISTPDNFQDSDIPF